jgi:multidrug resistance protein, MATE family
MNQLNIQKIKSEALQNMKLSLPLIASQVLYSSTGFLATLMLAHLGQNILAATVLIGMIWAALSVTFFGVLNAVSVLVSHQYGAKNTRAISSIMSQAWILSVIFIVIILALLSTAPYFLHLTHLPSSVLDLSTRYLRAIRLWVPSLVFMIMLEQFLIGVGKTRLVMWVSAILVPLQIGLIYCFVFGKCYLPKTGIAGVGYGVSIADTLGVLALVIYLLRAKQFKAYRLFTQFNYHWRYLKELIQVGIPIGMMRLIEVGAFTIMTYAIAYFGTLQLASHQIVFQFLGIMITIVFAMSQAVTVRVGHAVGALNRDGVNYAIGVGMGVNACVMLLLATILFLFPHWLISLDINVHDEKNYRLVHQVTAIFHVVAFLMIFDNFRIIGFGALRGIKDTRFPMIASLIAFWVVGLSLGLILGFVYNIQATGIWIGMTIGILSGALIILLRLKNRLRSIDLAKIRAIR